MPEVLYVGHYRDHTGYGRAALDWILALDAAGVEVACRPLRLNNADLPLPRRILELEARSANGAEVVIQHTLPAHTAYCGRFRKNVCLFHWETSSFLSTGWQDRLNAMDEVWVASRFELEACKASGVTKPVRLVRPAWDALRATAPFRVPHEIPEDDDGGVARFYTVGEFVPRKNLRGLVEAFHLAFDAYEPSELVIKTSPGSGDAVRALCADVKRSLSLPRSEFRRETVIDRRLDDAELLGLHRACDVFVTASLGEAVCLPAMDAAFLGKRLVLPYSTGFTDWAKDLAAFVACDGEPAVGLGPPYSAEQDVYRPRTRELARLLRGPSFRPLGAGKAAAPSFSYKTTGDLMKGLLNDRPRAGSELAGNA